MNNWFLLLILLFLISCSYRKDNYIAYNNENSKYWSNDSDEIDLVMSYILSSHKEYKKIIKMNNEDKIKFLDQYFSGLDPDTTTVKNESLEELNNRVMVSKKLFSGSDGGLLSDRAKIYIIYGAPNYEYQTYQNNLELFVWQYEIDSKIIEFKFINDTFGRYTLIMNDFDYINN